MIYIIKFIILFITFLGLSIFIQKKFKVIKEFSFALTAITIMLFLYIAGMLNILKIATIFLYAFGGLYFIYHFISHKKEKIKFDYRFIILLLLMIYIVFLAFNFRISSYDNFSHWALAIKQLFVNNTLSSFEYNMVEFTSYPPASSLFIYYVGMLVGKVEFSMILGQLFLTTILLTPLFVFIKKENKITNSIVFILFVLLIIIVNNSPSDLLVDTLLGCLGIFACTIAYYYRKNLKKTFYLLSLVSSTFIILKNAGILFVALCTFLLLIVGIYNKKYKKTFKYLLLLLIITGGVFYLWQSHLKMVYYANSGITTKHSLSLTNFQRTIGHNGIESSKEILIKFLSTFARFKNNYILWNLIGINIFQLICMIISKEYKKILKSMLLINVLYVGYWSCLGLMYVFSMPYEEAIVLACYNRYMLSCIIVLYGITFITLMDIKILKKKKIALSLFYVIIILTLMIYNPINSYKQLFGVDTGDYSARTKVKEIVEDYPIDEYKGKNIIFNYNNGFSTYHRFLLRYEYFYSNITVLEGRINISSIPVDTIIITPDGNDNIEKESKQLKKLKENIFLVDNKEVKK